MRKFLAPIALVLLTSPATDAATSCLPVYPDKVDLTGHILVWRSGGYGFNHTLTYFLELPEEITSCDGGKAQPSVTTKRVMLRMVPHPNGFDISNGQEVTLHGSLFVGIGGTVTVPHPYTGAPPTEMKYSDGLQMSYERLPPK